MSQRILEKRITSMAPSVNGDLCCYCSVSFIDTAQTDPDMRVVEEEVLVDNILSSDTMAQFEAKRSAAYRARYLEIFGSAPATAILIGFKAV